MIAATERMLTASESPTFDALSLLFHSSADCIKLLDLDGHLTLMNLGGATSMELEHCRQLVGCNWVDFWGPDDRAAAQDAVDTARAGGIGRSYGFLPTAKGTSKWWDSVVTPVRGCSGIIEQLLVVSRDVSERHRSNEAKLKLDDELQAALRRTEAVIRATSEIVWQADAKQKRVTEHGWTEFTGCKLPEKGRRSWLDTIHPDDRRRVDTSSRTAWAAGIEHHSEYRLFHYSGAYHWVDDRVVPIRNQNGEIVEWVGVVTDINDRVLSDQALAESEERLRLAISASRVGIWDVDLRTGARRWSAEQKEILGLPDGTQESEELLFRLIHPEDRGIVERAHRDTFLQTAGFPAIRFRINRADTGEERWILSSGRVVADQAGQAVRRLGTFQDITDQKRTEQRLWEAANTDSLTGLANRYRFSVDLSKLLRNAENDKHCVALFIIDIDNFKDINDTFGHVVGDQVLGCMAHRLAAFSKPGVKIARLGGDEFAMILANAGSTEMVEAEAENVIRTLSTPIDLDGRSLRCFTSLGVAIYPDHDVDGGELLKNADLALYNAKRAGRARHAVFEYSMKESLVRRMGVLQRARDALANLDIVPFYQPKVAMVGCNVCGFEALLRLREESSITGPAAIAEALDDPELSVAIGQRMLEAVIADIVLWRKEGLLFGSVAVNVSAAEFSRIDIAENWLVQLQKAGLPTSVLQMEVTESAFLDGDSDAVGSALSALDKAGIEIALDDFGTGFASLTHLRKFPVSILKIDQSFVRDLGNHNGADAIVSAVVGLAHGLGMRVVGEGVETPLQASMLTSIGCDMAQGYLAARAMPAASVLQFLTDWRGLKADASRL